MDAACTVHPSRRDTDDDDDDGEYLLAVTAYRHRSQENECIGAKIDRPARHE